MHWTSITDGVKKLYNIYSLQNIHKYTHEQYTQAIGKDVEISLYRDKKNLSNGNANTFLDRRITYMTSTKNRSVKMTAHKKE